MIELPGLGQAHELIAVIKGAIESTSLLLDFRKEPKVQAEVLKLQDAFDKARSTILEMYDRCEAVAKEKRELEEKVAKLEAWDEDKKNYRLRELAPGVLAFAYAPEGNPTQPPHWVCDRCYHEGKKSILQPQHQKTPPTMKCAACGNELHFPPPPPSRPVRVVRG